MQREQLHYLDVSEAFGKLVSKYGFDVESAAAKLCMSEKYVADKLRLLEYTEDERRAIREAGLCEAQAACILSVEDASMRAKVLSQVINNRLDKRATDELVFAYLRKRMRKADSKRPTYLIRDIRIFYNTIERALDVMRNAGFKISADKQENESCTYITIKIPKENA